MRTLPFVLLLAGCESLEPFRVQQTDVEGILDIGELRVIPADDYWTVTVDDGKVKGEFNPDWDPTSDEARADDELGRHGVYYGQVGATEDAAVPGGVTFSFTGTGGNICMVLDPEALFWSQARSDAAQKGDFLYEDQYADDGDLDFMAGISAYYTGAPGVEIGDFKIPYLDDQGVQHDIQFDECFVDVGGGIPSYSGRATVDTCSLNTAGREGVPFTGVLRTFSLPIDDSILNYGLALFEVGEGGCGGGNDGQPKLEADECTLPVEMTLGDYDSPTGCDAEADGDPWSWQCFEESYCSTSAKKFNEYCDKHKLDDDTPCIDNGRVVDVSDE